MTLTYVPPDGYRNTTAFPTKPASETAFRDSMQDLLDQIRDYVNSNIGPTSANITYFVATTGNDSNDGLTSGTALKTIQAAINKLPQTVNHTITINVAAGTYAETVDIEGFSGKGVIIIQGDSVVSTSRTVTSALIKSNLVEVQVVGINFNSDVTVEKANAKFANINSVLAATSGIVAGFGSLVNVASSTFSNKTFGALYAVNGGVLMSFTNTGTGNTIALRAEVGGTVIKTGGSQPAGTTAEFTGGGGVIR